MAKNMHTEQRKHILHVIDALTYGGAQELIVLLSKWTPKENFKTTVCVLQPNPELAEEIESSGVRVFCFNRPRPSIVDPLRFVSYFINNVRDIVALCRNEQVSIIQCHLSDAEFIGIFAGFLAGVRRILTMVHYPDLLPPRRPGDPRNFLRRFVTRLLYCRADWIIAVSDDVAAKVKDFTGINPAKIHTIINRIDVDSFRKTSARSGLSETLGISEGGNVIVTVARLMPPKGHIHLIDAMAGLTKKFPGLKLLLAGDGDLKEQLANRCASLGIMEKVRFLGNRSDVAEILRLANIFVLPSLWEGTSLALLEAMAAGKPIVATDIPGNRAVLAAEDSGLLVPPGDAAALEDAILHLLECPEIAGEYGRKALAAVKDRFDIRQSISQLEKLWA